MRTARPSSLVPVLGILVLGIVLAVAALASLAPAATAQSLSPAPEPEEGPEAGTEQQIEDQLVLSGRVAVRRGQAVGEVIVLNGQVVVGGVVRGDVLVIHGRVEILGQVAGDVLIFDGPVILREGAFVGGDVVARGDVRRDPDTTIEGRVRRDFPVSLREPVEALGRFATWTAVSVSMLVLGLLLLLFAPRGADAVFRAARDHRWGSAGLGLGVAIALPVLGLALLVSLAGIPLGLSVLFGLGLAYSIGYAFAAWVLGRWIVGPGRNRVLTLLVGWVTLRAVAAIPFAGGATWFLAGAFGLGGMTIAVWRARRPPATTAATWVGRTGTRAPVTAAAETPRETALADRPVAALAEHGEPIRAGSAGTAERARLSATMDAERLRGIELFDGLSDHDLEQVARWADEVDVPPGFRLADEGEFAHQFFVIQEGSAEVTVGDRHVADLGTGDFFGEIGLVEAERRVASVVATSPMRLIVMHERDFRAMEADFPQVASRIEDAIRERTARDSAQD